MCPSLLPALHLHRGRLFFAYFLQFLKRLPCFPSLAPRGVYRLSKILMGRLNGAGVLTRAGRLIKTYENLDSPFPAHTRTENGLVVPCMYHGRSPSHQVAKTLKNKLCKASKLHAHMHIEVSDTPVRKKSVFKN